MIGGTPDGVPPVRILVFGAGAIGQWMAARFASAGARVTVLCRRAAYEAIRSRGVRCKEAHGGWIDAQEVEAAETLAELSGAAFDWVFVTVKAFDVEGAMRDLRTAGVLAAGARVMGFQNGVGTEDVIASAVSPGHSFVCVVTRPISLTETPGEVEEANDKGGIAIAPYDGPGDFGSLEPALAACGLEVSRFDDHRPMKWSKLLLNMTANATCAIVDCTPAELYGDRRLFAIELAAFKEAADVMRALGLRAVDLPGYPAARLWLVMTALPASMSRLILAYKVGAARGSKQPSLRLEMERGRPESEIDWLNGAVDRSARRLGISAPANAFLTGTLHDILAGRLPWGTYRLNADRFVADFRRSMQQKAP